MTATAMGGLGVGLLEKSFGEKIPSLPYVGRKGAVALAIYFLNPKSTALRNVGIAAAAIAGYQLGSTGVISGEDDDEILVTD